MGEFKVGDCVRVVGQHGSQKFELGKKAMVIGVEDGGQSFPYKIMQPIPTGLLGRDEPYVGWVAPGHIEAAGASTPLRMGDTDVLDLPLSTGVPDGPGGAAPARDSTRPSYYLLPNGIECKDVVGCFPYNVGVAMAYAWRAGRKPGASVVEDLRKAVRHLEFEIERVGGDTK